MTIEVPLRGTYPAQRHGSTSQKGTTVSQPTKIDQPPIAVFDRRRDLALIAMVSSATWLMLLVPFMAVSPHHVLNQVLAVVSPLTCVTALVYRARTGGVRS